MQERTRDLAVLIAVVALAGTLGLGGSGVTLLAFNGVDVPNALAFVLGTSAGALANVVGSLFGRPNGTGMCVRWTGSRWEGPPPTPWPPREDRRPAPPLP